ncbi:LysR family transcriptional regulator [Nocardioides ginsengisoli]|uniref:LysR family transcriptional regulator n=1 Tax=Nocardioides ginsengisoli TaxID=363868 RepID=A0ABW3VT86_9ACTN
MRIEQLEYVAAAIEHRSLRRAGERLHVSQAALSEGISKLERELGVDLLERHRAGVRPTETGALLLPHVLEALEALERVRTAGHGHQALPVRLRVGTVNAGTASLLLPAAQAVTARHAGTSVDIQSLQQADIVTRLGDGALDLGLINVLDGDDPPPDLSPVPLRTGTPMVVLSTTHPLAGESSVGIDALRDEPFIGMRSGYLMHRYAHRLFGDDLPRTWHTTDGAEMGAVMVAEGLGVTILPDYSVNGSALERAGLITTRPIAGTDATVSVVALHRRSARKPVALQDLLIELRRASDTTYQPEAAV